MSDPARRNIWLDAAKRIHDSGSDEEALAIMQEVTGLSMTDPVADNIELDRRRRASETNRGDTAADPPTIE